MSAPLGGFSFQAPAAAKEPKPKPPKPPRARIDPKHVKAVRELRDRYLERVNAHAGDALPTVLGKYDLSRASRALPAATGPAGNFSGPVEGLLLPEVATDRTASSPPTMEAAA